MNGTSAIGLFHAFNYLHGYFLVRALCNGTTVQRTPFWFLIGNIALG
jgi:hypothetical protein